ACNPRRLALRVIAVVAREGKAPTVGRGDELLARFVLRLDGFRPGVAERRPNGQWILQRLRLALLHIRRRARVLRLRRRGRVGVRRLPLAFSISRGRGRRRGTSLRRGRGLLLREEEREERLQERFALF